MKNYDIIVIGAGPAGMMAAGTAAQNNAKVLLLERNEKPGRKLMITGKGRCNVCNNSDNEVFISSVVTNGRFLYSAISAFSATDTMSFFEKLSVPLKTERGNRVFPVSDKACDIVDAMKKFVYQSKAELVCGRVSKIETENGEIKSVKCEDGAQYGAKKVIIACGGASYPQTGSTGDGYSLARAAGHTIKEIKPSLVPIVSKDEDCKKMQGLSLRNCAVKIWDNKKGKDIYKDFGEMMFTHFGVTGPVILSAGSHIRSMEGGRYKLIIDLKPALSEEKLDTRIQRDFSENLNRDFGNSLSALLPHKMIPVVVERSGIRAETKCNAVTREERRRLVSVLKNFEVSIDGFRPISEAIITSGGVSVKEIEPKTMESKIQHGLYFAGEVIDVDAYTGGFNLQIAFSTGFLAGKSASEKETEL